MDEKKVLYALESFKKSKIKVEFVILDDGWQSISAEEGKRLISFEADRRKFPGGLKRLISRAKKKHHIKYFGVWHALEGYWNGIVPSDLLPYRFVLARQPRMVKLQPDGTIPVQYICNFVSPEDAGKFFNDYHLALKNEGVDLVKVDVQGLLPFYFIKDYCIREETVKAYSYGMQHSAEKYFNSVILQNGSMAEEARYRLLAVLMDTRQYVRAKQTAEKLLEAKTPEYANYGRYRLAELTELEGNLALARKLYLEYLNKAPASTLASAAAFSAAQLAEKSGDLTIAAAEYLDFVRKYPGDINAAPSLFLALRADCLSGGKQIAEKCLELMTKSYSQTKEYNASLLQFADYFFNHGNYSRALELLKKKNKLKVF